MAQPKRFRKLLLFQLRLAPFRIHNETQLRKGAGRLPPLNTIRAVFYTHVFEEGQKAGHSSGEGIARSGGIHQPQIACEIRNPERRESRTGRPTGPLLHRSRPTRTQDTFTQKSAQQAEINVGPGHRSLGVGRPGDDGRTGIPASAVNSVANRFHPRMHPGAVARGTHPWRRTPLEGPPAQS